jgi:hypothetical protein
VADGAANMRAADRQLLADFNSRNRRLFLRPSLWTRVRRWIRARLFGAIK